MQGWASSVKRSFVAVSALVILLAFPFISIADVSNYVRTPPDDPLSPFSAMNAVAIDGNNDFDACASTAVGEYFIWRSLDSDEMGTIQGDVYPNEDPFSYQMYLNNAIGEDVSVEVVYFAVWPDPFPDDDDYQAWVDASCDIQVLEEFHINGDFTYTRTPSDYPHNFVVGIDDDFSVQFESTEFLDQDFVQFHIGNNSACSAPVANDGSPVVWNEQWNVDPDSVDGFQQNVAVIFSNDDMSLGADGCMNSDTFVFDMNDSFFLMDGESPEISSSTSDVSLSDSGIASIIGIAFFLFFISCGFMLWMFKVLTW